MSRLITAILLLAVAAGIAVFALRPQWAAVGRDRAAIAELQLLERELTDLAAGRDALTAEYNAIAESDLEKLRAVAPADRGTAAVLTDFEALTQRNALALDQVDFTGGEKSSAATGLAAAGAPSARLYGTIPVTLSLRGTYDNFREFLLLLEKNLRLVDVDGLNLSSSRGQESAMTVKATIYYRRK